MVGKSLVKKWILTILVVVGLAILAVSAPQWLPLLLGFVGARSDLIQGLEALAQLGLAAGGALVFLSRLWCSWKPKQHKNLESKIPGRDTSERRNVIIDGNTSDSILTTGNRNIVQRGDSNVHITVNQESFPLGSTAEADRAKAERIREETNAKVIEHLLKQNESRSPGRHGQITDITASQRPCSQGKKSFFEGAELAHTTEHAPKISLPHESPPLAGQTPVVKEAEELTEQLSEQWSHRSIEQTNLSPLPDAERRLLEIAGQQFLVAIKRLIDELEIEQAIVRAQELKLWLDSNSPHIPAPLGFALYSELMKIKGKQVRRASSDADRRAYLAEAELLFRKAQDERRKF